MTAFSIIFLILVVGAAIIAIYSQVKPAPILWIAVLLLAIAMAISMGGSEHLFSR
jgi:hypothetical protein